MSQGEGGGERITGFDGLVCDGPFVSRLLLVYKSDFSALLSQNIYATSGISLSLRMVEPFLNNLRLKNQMWSHIPLQEIDVAKFCHPKVVLH